VQAPLDFFIGPRDVEVIDIPVFTKENK
jgi:hypothetical protein